MPLPAEYDVVLLCTHDTVQVSMFCAHLHLYEPVHYALIITSTTQYLIRSKGLICRITFPTTLKMLLQNKNENSAKIKKRRKISKWPRNCVSKRTFEKYSSGLKLKLTNNRTCKFWNQVQHFRHFKGTSSEM